MQKTIQILEEIGQHTSLNQFESINEMISDLDKYEEVLSLLNLNNDLICGQFQEDDDDEEEEKEKE